MRVWFEGETAIACSLGDVKSALDDIGEHFLRVVSVMPGLSSVELIEQGDGFVTIRTNEGLMKRTNITTELSDDGVVVEYDEEHQAGSMVTTTAHFRDAFTANVEGVVFRTAVSGLKAPGFLGFLYRTFGSGSMGKAFLNATREALEPA